MNKATFSTGHEQSKWHTYSTYLKYLAPDRTVPERIYEQAFRNVLRVLQFGGPRDVQGLRILEIGCGQRFAATLLFHSLGGNITGVDVDYVDPNFGLDGYFKILHTNGLERLLKTIVRHTFFDRSYYASLARCFASEFQRPLRWDGIDVRLMDARNLQFPDNHFDFIFSRAVFEHIDGVDAACREIARVLQPGGTAFIEVHLFASLSGGHNLQWAQRSKGKAAKVPPWDHLRKNRYPAPCFLNKLRLHEYLDCFKSSFNILDVRYAYEGEEYLTDDILHELPQYESAELLTKTLGVVLQKPQPGA